MPRVFTFTIEDFLSLVKNLKQKRSAYVRIFISMMKKIRIDIHEISKKSFSHGKENENMYQVKLLREDMNKQITFTYSAELRTTPDSTQLLRDILRNISRYGDVPEDFDEFCNVVKSWYPGFPANEDDHRSFLRESRKFKKIFTENELRIISKVSPPSIWLKIDRREKDNLTELGDEVDYYKKRISRYGFNTKTGELNTNSFPVTKEDKEMKVIISDVKKYNNALERYEKYERRLIKKYKVDPGRDALFYHSNLTREDLATFGLEPASSA